MSGSVGYVGALAAFISSVTWAFASVRYAEAAHAVGSVRVNLLRALTATLFWGATLLIVHGADAFSGVSGEQAFWLAASIACSYAIGDGIFFAAAQRLGVSTALAIATIYPLWAALYGALVRGEPLGAGRVLGMTCCLVGVSALLRLSRKTEPQEKHGAAALGVGLALLASLFWAGNAVFLKLGAEGVTVYRANALRFSFGALFLLAQILGRNALRQSAPLPAMDGGFAPLARRLALALIADTGLGSVCYVYGIAHTDLALGATLSSLSPLAAMPIGVALGSERVTLARALSVCVTVSGVVLLVISPS